jgi:DNA-binding response OmpR family regulator
MVKLQGGIIVNTKNRKRFDSILLVEDEEDHARLIKKSLNGHGLRNDIFWVKNGAEALEYMKRTGKYNKENAPRPGLVLLDIKLPMKDGFEVLEELKSDEMYKTIPVVMLTTTSETDDINRALKLGANDYIVKPVKFSDFIEKVGKVGYYWEFTSDLNRQNNK